MPNLIFIIFLGQYYNFAFLYTVTEKRPVMPRKCLPAYLITLANETKFPCPYYPDYIQTDIHLKLVYQYEISLNPIVLKL